MKDKLIEFLIWIFVIATILAILFGFYMVVIPAILMCAGLGICIILFEQIIKLVNWFSKKVIHYARLYRLR